MNINHWLLIALSFITTNFIGYKIQKIKIKKLSKKDRIERENRLKNYNKIVIKNIVIILLLSCLYLQFTDKFAYNFNMKQISC